MKNALAIILFLISFHLSAQKAELTKYLNAYKTSEFEESQVIIKEYSFDQRAEYTMSEYSYGDGLLFNTDISSIQGFKVIINCKLKNKADGFIDKRMLIVMYYDKTKKHYSVFDICEAADSKSNYLTYKKEVDDGKFNLEKEYEYRSLSYWALMSGQIKEAKKYIDLAIEEAKLKNNNFFNSFNVDLILQRIM